MKTELKVSTVCVQGNVRYVPICINKFLWDALVYHHCISDSLDTYNFEVANVEMFSTQTHAEAASILKEYHAKFIKECPHSEVTLMLG